MRKDSRPDFELVFVAAPIRNKFSETVMMSNRQE